MRAACTDRTVAQLAILAVLAAAPAMGAAGDEDRPDGKGLWERSLIAQRLPDMRARVLLVTYTASGDRISLELDALGKLAGNGVDRMLLARVTSGGSLQRTTFLSVEHRGVPDDLWMFLPALGRPKRLVSSNLGDSFLGSELRFGDLLQPDVDDYVVHNRGVEVIDGASCWRLETIPRDPGVLRNVGLAREVRWLERQDLLERRIEQYDRNDRLLKVMIVRQWTAFGAPPRWLALERRIDNVQTATRSTATFSEVRVGMGVAESLFGPESLSSQSW